MRSPQVLLLVFLTGAAEVDADTDGFASYFFGGDERCLLVEVLDGKNLTYASAPRDDRRRQTVLLSTNLNRKSVVVLSRWLGRVAWCAVASIRDSGVGLRRTLELTKRVPRHAVVVYGERRPGGRTLRAAEAPVVWVQSEARLEVIHLSCPTVRKDASAAKMRKVNSRKDDGDGSLVPLLPEKTDPAALCGNPMLDQDLSYVYLDAVPAVLSPSLTGGRRELAGHSVQIFRFLARAFRFRPRFYEGAAVPYFDRANRTWGGQYADVSAGSAFVARARHLYTVGRAFDLSFPFLQNEKTFVSRRPRPVLSYSHVVKPLPAEYWLLLSVCLTYFGVAFFVAHRIYEMNPASRLLNVGGSGHRRPWTDFLLLSFARFTEPGPLNLFREEFSTGRFLTLLWTLLSTFSIMFYCSDLRAKMVAVVYERPVDTLRDVVDNGKTVFVHASSKTFRTDYLESKGMTDTVEYQVAKLAESSGGVFNDLAGSRQRRAKEILTNGAVMLANRHAVPYLYLWDSGEYRMTRDKLHLSREDPYKEPYHLCFIMRKHGAATPYVNGAVQRAVEAGLNLKYAKEFLPIGQTLDSRRRQSKSKEKNSPLELTSFYLTMACYGGVVAAATTAFLAEVTERRKGYWVLAVGHRLRWSVDRFGLRWRLS